MHKRKNKVNTSVNKLLHKTIRYKKLLDEVLHTDSNGRKVREIAILSLKVYGH